MEETKRKNEQKKSYRNNWKNNKVAISMYLSIIILDISEPNAPTIVSDWIEKTRPSICYLQEIHFRTKDTPRLKVRVWRKIFHANINDKKTTIAILISDKIYFRTKFVTKDKERYYIMIKGSKQKEGVAFVNMYVPKYRSM